MDGSLIEVYPKAHILCFCFFLCVCVKRKLNVEIKIKNVPASFCDIIYSKKKTIPTYSIIIILKQIVKFHNYGCQ